MKQIVSPKLVRLMVIRNIATFVIIFVFLLASCAGAKQTVTPTKASTNTDTPEPTLTATMTPTIFVPTATRFPKRTHTPTPINADILDFTIEATQIPIVVSTNEPADSKYIYKYTIVTFTTDSWEGENYLNLDNVYDNSADKVDIVLSHDSGSGGTSYAIYPVNGVSFYYSDLHSMSYDSCMEHYPFTNMDEILYTVQGNMAGTGRDYCVLTTDGRLSIVRLIQKTMDAHSDDGEFTYPELVVTTYNWIAVNYSTPFAPTPGPSPTPSKYSDWNLTNNQIIGLNLAGQKFLTAVTAGDKETVETMLDYPVYVEINGETDESFHVNNKEEFLAAYSKIFTPELVDEFAVATVENNMGPRYASIALIVPDCAVFFHPDGSISEFSVSTVWWEY